MKTSDFDFNLPPELIAQYPCAKRSASRLLCLDKETGRLSNRKFIDLPDLLSPNDLLIFNDTRVIPARLYGKKSTGGKVEILIERILDEHRVLAHMRFSKTPRIGMKIFLLDSRFRGNDDYKLEVLKINGELFELYFHHSDSVINILQKIGHIPLPPYITRKDEKIDQERYQTIFARHDGAIAAPTAGLHFDEELMRKINAKKINTAFVTLHVGAGTFQPVRVENITEHKMHAEYIEVPPQVCEQIKAAKKNGGRVIAVGTTCVRSLETASKNGAIAPYTGETDIFIYPGFKFNCIDALITNFHLPKSTLLMLVCAFAGFDNTMRAYQEAVKARYRFFSYGDAMFVY
jgi:S-adenosylmethionine:tRNA ribosyltransferase-isomerase